MGKKVLYFAYGANRSPEMIRAIVGRIPKGTLAKLKNYELCIQVWKEIPHKIRNQLKKSWKSNFRTYIIRRKTGGSVSGRIWELTKLERKLVTRWEFWYKPTKVKVRTFSGKIVNAETEIINDPKIKLVVRSGKYKNFLNSEKRMLEVANRDREGFLSKTNDVFKLDYQK